MNVASTSGKRPSTGMPAYSVTKAAVLSLSRLVADTYAADGIRCNAVCPGPTLTPAWLDIGGLADQTAADSDRSRDEVLKAIGRRPADRSHGRAARDRLGDRVSVLAAVGLRHRRGMERRRRHDRDHHLTAGGGVGYTRRLPCRTPTAPYPTDSPPASRRTRSGRSAHWRCAPTRRPAAASPRTRCSLRTPFQRDRDRIVHCKAFRRLKHKTQVFIAPEGDHFRTRLSHTLEVSGISRGIARALRLNEDLVEAVALGHDLGHAPFGHTGEEALDRGAAAYGLEFRHNRQSLRVVDVLERDGAGPQPHQEVRDGILNHTGPDTPATLEGRIVRLADRFAYLNHDIDDAVRGRDPRPRDAAPGPIELMGTTSSMPDRRCSCTTSSRRPTAAGDIVQSAPFAEALLELRAFMFEHIYLGPAARVGEHRRRGDGDGALRPPPGAHSRPGRGRRLGLGHDRPLRAARLRGATA